MYESYPTEADAEAEDPDYEREEQEDGDEHDQGEVLEEDDQDTYE